MKHECVLSVFVLSVLSSHVLADSPTIIGQPFPPFKSQAAAVESFSTIVGGTITKDYPAVGALVGNTTDGKLLACSGTIIGCRWFATAGHCVAKLSFKSLLVFLPSKGFYSVTTPPHIPDAYKACPDGFNSACPQADIALLELDSAVDGISTLPVTRNIPVPPGDTGTIVGFGTTTSKRLDFGIKRRGAVTAGRCKGTVAGADDESWLCWTFLSKTTATICNADSGGPYLASNGAVGGIASGDIGPACATNDKVFDTRMRHYVDWLAQVAGTEIHPGACGSGPQAGEQLAPIVQISNDKYIPNGTLYSHALMVDADVSELELSVSGSGSQFNNVTEVSLTARLAGADGTDAHCTPRIAVNFANCSIASPSSGLWQVLVSFKTKEPQKEVPFVYQIIATEFIAKH